MSFEIRTTERFRKEAKRLSKKYPSLKNDLLVLLTQLEDNPKAGKALGNHFYKIRLQIKSKGKGKSGGARVITHVEITLKNEGLENGFIYVATIYDKSEISSIDEAQLKFLLKEIKNEFSK